MRYLCIDTSNGSRVALVAGENIRRAHSDSPRAHAEALAGLIREVSQAQAGEPLAGRFDCIVVGRGPAPYTGLRAGLITAKTLGKALEVPVYGISALDLAARCAFDQGEPETVVATLDARRKELYAGTYRPRGNDDVELVDEIRVCLPGDLVTSPQATLVGPAADLYPLESVRVGTTAFDVAVLARLASARLTEGVEMSTEPLYLRRPDVSVPNRAKSALGK